MANISTQYKRLFLQGLFWDAEEQGKSLAYVLRLAARGQLQQTSRGTLIQSVAAEGHTTSFMLPAGGRSIMPHEVAELLQEFLDRYDEAKAALIAAGTASPTDSQLFAEIKAHLNPVRSVTNDFSSLRTGPEEVTA